MNVSCWSKVTRNSEVYVLIPIRRTARAGFGFCILSMLKRNAQIVDVDAPKKPPKAWDSRYLVAVSSMIVWRLAAAAVVLSSSAWEIRILVCMSSCA